MGYSLTTVLCLIVTLSTKTRLQQQIRVQSYPVTLPGTQRHSECDSASFHLGLIPSFHTEHKICATCPSHSPVK